MYTFFKKSNCLNNRLKTKLKAGGITRPWRSFQKKFKSFYDNYNEIKDILIEKKLNNFLENFDQDIIKTCYEFFDYFNLIFDILESNKTNLNAIIPIYYTIKLKLPEKLTNNNIMQVLLHNLNQVLDEKYLAYISNYHILASF